MFLGCVQSPPEPAEAVATFAEFPADHVTMLPPLRPEPDPFFAVGEATTPEPVKPEPAEPKPMPLPPVGYTGVRIYGDPGTCNPCRFLQEDLRFLRDFHGWTLSDSAAIAADWQFLPARSTDWQVPLIEVWNAGTITETHAGYIDEANPAARREVLRELIARHPIRTLER